MVYVIEVHGLVKTYGKVRALNGFDLSVRKNTVHALVGPNGSGKSTAVKVLAGEVRPDTGSATIDDLPVTSPEMKRMVAQVPDICRIPDNQTPKDAVVEARQVVPAVQGGHFLPGRRAGRDAGVSTPPWTRRSASCPGA